MVFHAPSILVLCMLLLHTSNVTCWTDAEFEMFDLVEEVGENFYDVLGLQQESSFKDIKQAYRRLSLKLHPDKNKADDAEIKFRQLVAIYEVLKDKELREAYHDVLVNGLPNWKQPKFYFRRARKFALWQVGLMLLVIVSIGQYLAAWASYFEQKLTLKEIIGSKMKRVQKKKRKEKDLIAEELSTIVDQCLEKPSVFNTAPFQLMRFFRYCILQLPLDIVALIKAVKARKEEQLRKQEELLELEKKRKEEAEQPRRPRKRKAFVAPEKQGGKEQLSSSKRTETIQQKPSSPVYSGGLWTDDDINELTKLCAKYPGGTPERWEKIADALKRPVPEVAYMAKKVLQNLTGSKTDENPEAEEAITTKTKVKTKGGKKIAENSTLDPSNWTSEEQKLLEQALLNYPKGSTERWEKISNHIPGRSKEDCMQRFKYVAELVRKKKEDVASEAAKADSDKCEGKDENPSPEKVLKSTENVSQNLEDVKDKNVESGESCGDVHDDFCDTSGRKNSSSSDDWCLVDNNDVSNVS